MSISRRAKASPVRQFARPFGNNPQSFNGGLSETGSRQFVDCRHERGCRREAIKGFTSIDVNGSIRRPAHARPLAWRRGSRNLIHLACSRLPLSPMRFSKVTTSSVTIRPSGIVLPSRNNSTSFEAIHRKAAW